MMTNFLLIILLLTFAGCTTSIAHQNPREEKTVSTSRDQVPPAQEQRTPITLANTLGVVVLSDKYGKNDFIRIYNQDGSLWHRFTLYSDDSDDEFNYTREEFRPFAFHPNYFLLTLTCVGKDKGRYEVVVNEQTRLTKYVNVDDTTMRFETWDDHVLHVYHIGFNKDENPLRRTPDGPLIDPKLFSAESQVSGVEINGEWLRVEWTNTPQTPDDEPEYYTAWIRWKANGILLIDLVYLC